ncbi:MAG: hypothetical protein AB1916_13345 [Thermodesulfobacteriota bacterium]
MTDQSAPRRIHPLLALLLGVVGLGIMGGASVVFMNMLEGFATDPWLVLLPKLALAMGLFSLGFWVFVRGTAAFLRSSPPEE